MNKQFNFEVKQLCRSLLYQAQRQEYEEGDDSDFFANPWRRVQDEGTRLRILLERVIIRRLVRDVLKEDESLAISVFDGEDTVVYHSRDLDEIMSALMSTESDELHVFHITTEGGYRTAWFQCVYGNAAWEVIADYSERSLLPPFSAGAFSLASAIQDLALEPTTN